MPVSDFAAQRLSMLESQLLPNQITEPRLLAAMGAVPRELFLPKRLAGVAYVDEDIPIGGGRMLIEPLVLARLIQLAAPGESESVLDVGCGTGYSTAVLARLARQVTGLECAPALAAEAEQRLRDLGVRNASVVKGPLEAGHPPRAPYDAIIIGGAVELLPDALAAQLAEGGRLATVLRRGPGLGRVTLMEKRHGQLSRRSVFDAGTALLPGFVRPAEFVF